MQPFSDVRVWGKLVVVFIFIAILGIAPRSHRVVTLMHQAQRAISFNAHADAAGQIAQAARQMPWRGDLWLLAGEQAYQAGNFEPEIDYLQKAAALDDLSADGYVRLGDAYLGEGHLSEATQNWQTAIRMGAPEFETLSHMFQAQLACRDVGAAVESLSALLKIRPLEASLQYQMGLLLATRQPELALGHLSQAAVMDAGHASQAGILADAVESSLEIDNPAYQLVVSGQALASIGEWDLAGEAFRQANTKQPDYAEAWAFWGEALQQQAVQSAQPAGEETEAGLPDCGCCARDFGAKDAQSFLEKALALDPESLSANTFMALYWQRQADYSRAIQYLRTATGLDPANPVLFAELGDALALDGDLQAALEAYQHATELASNANTFLKLLVNFSIKYRYQLEETGLPTARQALRQNPQDPDCLDLMGQVFYQLEDLNSAEVYFKAVLDINPQDASALLHLGETYLRKGEYAQAKEVLTQVQSLAPGSILAETALSLLQANFP